MNKEFLLLREKHTDTLLEKTRCCAQECLELKTNKQMDTFSYIRSMNLVEEGKWLLAVTSLELMTTVFNITDQNNSFSITIPGHWKSETDKKTINELNKLLGPESQSDTDTHVEQVRKKN